MENQQAAQLEEQAGVGREARGLLGVVEAEEAITAMEGLEVAMPRSGLQLTADVAAVAGVAVPEAT